MVYRGTRCVGTTFRRVIAALKIKDEIKKEELKWIKIKDELQAEERKRMRRMRREMALEQADKKVDEKLV